MLTKTSLSAAARRLRSARGVHQAAWSETIRFASPESDFCQGRHRQVSTSAPGPVWSQSLSFASPESDFGAWTTPSRAAFSTARPNVWSGTLSFASPESDFCAESPLPVALPQTLAEALMLESRPVVVTTPEAPFSIVHVNEAWEDLCGFTKKEALHQSLAMIQGPDSNTELAAHMVEKLVHTQEEQDVYLMNYTKAGEAFTNHLRAGVLRDEDSNVQFLVGILEKVDRSEVPLRMAY